MKVNIKNHQNENIDNFSINFMGYGKKEKIEEIKRLINNNSDMKSIMNALDNKISKRSTGLLFYYLSKGYTLSFENIKKFGY